MLKPISKYIRTENGEQTTDASLAPWASQSDVYSQNKALQTSLAETQATNAEMQNKLDASKNDLTGPGRTMSNVLAGGTLGLGIASFLDNIKTAKLQREAMKENLQMARDDQAARKARTAGWSNVFGGNQ